MGSVFSLSQPLQVAKRVTSKLRKEGPQNGGAESAQKGAEHKRRGASHRMLSDVRSRQPHAISLRSVH